MNPQQAYNLWAAQYDTDENKTRDLEYKALQKTLSAIAFDHCLEVGCGTGKNTSWLSERAKSVTALDFSDEMLAKAKEKITAEHVSFVLADINTDWGFEKEKFDLITFSLVLEHIEHLEPIFWQASKVLKDGGHVYMGELHPFKQYTGSKARFETAEGLNIIQCFTHHISDFLQPAQKHGFTIQVVNEYFDDDDRTSIPRILTILLQKQSQC